MTIEELDKKALYLSLDIQNELKFSDDIVDLSVEFAIEVLEDVDNDILNIPITKFEYCIVRDIIKSKIQELKQSLDETNKD